MPGAADSGGATGSGAGLTQSPIVAPFLIEVIQGDEATLQQAYPLSEGSEPQESVFGNATGDTVTYDTGQVQVFFRHPNRDNVIIVITDWVSQYPGRESQAAMVAESWRPLLESLTFTDQNGMFDFASYGILGDSVISSGEGASTVNQGSDQGGATPAATATP